MTHNPLFTLVVSLFLVYFLIPSSKGASCDIHPECEACAASGCAWCSATQECQATNSDTSNCGCVKNNTNPGTQCASQLCSTYDLCFGCVSGGCGWCEDTQQCVESQPLSLPTGPCVTGDCPDALCWKNTMSNDYFHTKCTNGPCDSWPQCHDCVKNGCVWCETSQQCLPSNTLGSGVCGIGNSCNNSEECLKNTYGSNFMVTKCPQTTCASMPNCRACIQSGCGWCESTGTCEPVTNDGTNSCVVGGCTNADACFKSSMDSSGDPYEDKCTLVNCQAQINCQACAAAGCGWCESTQSCLPISSNALQTCGAQGCPNLGDCLKANISDSANFSKCSNLPCSEFSGSCYVCVQNGCGWCSATQQCLPSSYPGDAGPCGGSCNASTGCWKHSPINTAENKCSPRVCSGMQTCGTCTSLGCGWCAWNSTCVEAQFFPDAFPQSPDSCGGTCPNPEKCWKTDPSQQCGLGRPTCSAAKSCRSCVTTPGVSCGWCHTENKCGELSVDSTEVCADCNQDSWNIISNINDCFDCRFDICARGTCNATTGNCVCPPNYYGPPCDVFCSPEANCSGGGQCLIGPDMGLTCICDEFYYGDACQYYCNPNETCSGHGSCTNVTGGNGPGAMQCVCENRWENHNGALCSLCPAPFFGDICKFCCDPAINCSNNGNCSSNCSCQCMEPYTGHDCSTFVGIYPARAWEITIGLFIGLAIVTIITCILISGQLAKLNPNEFPGVIYLSKFTNIISIGVSLVAYGQLILYAFKPPESWLPDSSSNSTLIDDGQPTIHLPFNLSMPEVSYPLWFWLIFSTCVFFFICALWVLLSVRFAPRLNNVIHAFALDLILTCVWPGIGSGLYFPIMEGLFSAFNCKYVPHSAKMYLIVDKDIICFEHEHAVYLACSGIAILLYYPLCLRILPLSQSMKQHYEHYRHHIIYQPKFLLFEAQIKLLILLSRMYFTSQTVKYELWTSLALLACILMLFLLTFFMRPCVSSGKVNLWRCVGYIIVLCSVAANATTYIFPPPSYIPSFILLASWAIVLFFSVYLHRAIFHADTTLSKYWSMSVDVRKSEYTPLLINNPNLNIQG